MNVLLTGGMGYIGSHIAVELIAAGHSAIIADNLANSSASVAGRIERITGVRPKLYTIDVADRTALERVFAENRIDAVIHLAGLKAVGESVAKPLLYYRCNLGATITLLETMAAHDCRSFIFSSSATVYGSTNPIPYTEDMPTGGGTSPYAQTKLMIEQILRDAAVADPRLSVVLLRYFNPIGAHESGQIGEAPNGIPNNLMPYLCLVAAGKLPQLRVFGGDYPTRDGTCLRDYIHVVDLAKGHLRALDWAQEHAGVETFNLGTGRGCSVLELVEAFERANGIGIPREIVARRAGDIAESWADPSKAERLLGWKAQKTIDDMCRDSWNWTKNSLLQPIAAC